MQIRASKPKRSPLHGSEEDSLSGSPGVANSKAEEEAVKRRAPEDRVCSSAEHTDELDAAHFVGFQRYTQATGRSIQATEYALCREHAAGSPLQMSDAVGLHFPPNSFLNTGPNESCHDMCPLCRIAVFRKSLYKMYSVIAEPLALCSERSFVQSFSDGDCQVLMSPYADGRSGAVQGAWASRPTSACSLSRSGAALLHRQQPPIA